MPHLIVSLVSNDLVNISGSIEMPFDINPGGHYRLSIEMSKGNNRSLSSSFYLNLYEEVAKGQILKFSGFIELIHKKIKYLLYRVFVV